MNPEIRWPGYVRLLQNAKQRIWGAENYFALAQGDGQWGPETALHHTLVSRS